MTDAQKLDLTATKDPWSGHSARDVDYWVRRVHTGPHGQTVANEGVLRHCGWLIKRGHRRKNFKRRFFTLTSHNGDRVLLRYYSSNDCVCQKGQIDLSYNTRTAVSLGASGRSGHRIGRLAAVEVYPGQYEMRLEVRENSHTDGGSSSSSSGSSSSGRSSSGGRCYELLLLAGDLSTKREWQQQLQSAAPHLHVDISEAATPEQRLTEEACRQVTHSGWLAKRGHLVPNTKRRWFKLAQSRLEYFSDSTCNAGSKRGEMRLDAGPVSVRLVDMRRTGKRFSFEVTMTMTMVKSRDVYASGSDNDDGGDRISTRTHTHTLTLFADTERQRLTWAAQLVAAAPQARKSAEIGQLRGSVVPALSRLHTSVLMASSREGSDSIESIDFGLGLATGSSANLHDADSIGTLHISDSGGSSLAAPAEDQQGQQTQQMQQIGSRGQGSVVANLVVRNLVTMKGAVTDATGGFGGAVAGGINNAASVVPPVPLPVPSINLPAGKIIHQISPVTGNPDDIQSSHAYSSNLLRKHSLNVDMHFQLLDQDVPPSTPLSGNQVKREQEQEQEQEQQLKQNQQRQDLQLRLRQEQQKLHEQQLLELEELCVKIDELVDATESRGVKVKKRFLQSFQQLCEDTERQVHRHQQRRRRRQRRQRQGQEEEIKGGKGQKQHKHVGTNGGGGVPKKVSLLHRISSRMNKSVRNLTSTCQTMNGVSAESYDDDDDEEDSENNGGEESSKSGGARGGSRGDDVHDLELAEVAFAPLQQMAQLLAALHDSVLSRHRDELMTGPLEWQRQLRQLQQQAKQAMGIEEEPSSSSTENSTRTGTSSRSSIPATEVAEFSDSRSNAGAAAGKEQLPLEPYERNAQADAGTGDTYAAEDEAVAEELVSEMLLAQIEAGLFHPLQRRVHSLLESQLGQRERALVKKMRALRASCGSRAGLQEFLDVPTSLRLDDAQTDACSRLIAQAEADFTLPTRKGQALCRAAAEIFRCMAAAKDKAAAQADETASAADGVVAKSTSATLRKVDSIADTRAAEDTGAAGVPPRAGAGAGLRAGSGAGSEDAASIGADDWLPGFIYCVVEATLAEPLKLQALLGGGAGGHRGGLADPLRRGDGVLYYATMLQVALAYVADLTIVTTLALPVCDDVGPGVGAERGSDSMNSWVRPPRSTKASLQIGLKFETDFYGRGAVIKEIEKGGLAECAINTMRKQIRSAAERELGGRRSSAADGTADVARSSRGSISSRTGATAAVAAAAAAEGVKSKLKGKLKRKDRGVDITLGSVLVSVNGTNVVNKRLEDVIMILKNEATTTRSTDSGSRGGELRLAFASDTDYYSRILRESQSPVS